MKHYKFLILMILFSPGWGLAQNASQRNTKGESNCGCKELAALSLPNVEITATEELENQTFLAPGTQQTIAGLPVFCRVAATLRPTADSKIRIEVWLPKENWNGRFLGTGTGGGAGGINYGGLANGLKRGFATTNTDMGTSPGANEAVGHPEKWVDFGHRATHEMTVTAKAITEAYYCKKISKAYFAGCSTGGQQALMEAQRYPDDYHGILAGAPANNRTHLHTGFVWNYKVTNQAPGVNLSRAKLKLITRAIIAACAGKDGGAPGDNFLTDPAACQFDPGTLPVCPEGTSDSTCLTKSELAVVRKIYQGPVNPRTGERIYTPIPYGSESITSGIEYQQNPKQGPPSLFYQYKWVFGKDFDGTAFDFDKDQERLDSVLAPVLNANNPDLEPFRKHGGKLLMYAGTADPLVPYQDAAHYYDRAIDENGGMKKTQSFFRFFVIPGMAHCGGGPGLNDCGQSLTMHVPQDKDHDMLTALIDWVEKGRAPKKFIVAGYNGGIPDKGVRLRRPVYTYPSLPKYTGGNPSLPENYKGVAHPRRRVPAPAKVYLR